MSKYVRKRTSEALQRALGAQPDAKGGKWTASDEAAAIGGVIDFLQDYMKRDGNNCGRLGRQRKDKGRGRAVRVNSARVRKQVRRLDVVFAE